MLGQVKKSIISIFDRYLNDNYILFIFGSFAKDNIDRASDIDLAIYTEMPLSSLLIAELKEELERKVPTLRSIDLVNLTDSAIDKKILENILKEGRLWKTPKNSSELLRSLKKRLKNLKK